MIGPPGFRVADLNNRTYGFRKAPRTVIRDTERAARPQLHRKQRKALARIARVSLRYGMKGGTLPDGTRPV